MLPLGEAGKREVNVPASGIDVSSDRHSRSRVKTQTASACRPGPAWQPRLHRQPEKETTLSNLRMFAEEIRDIGNLHGTVAYSGTRSWEQPATFYFLGINPGGDPTSGDTIGQSIDACYRLPPDWSAYDADDWETDHVRHSFQSLVKTLPSNTPCSNGIFVRSENEQKLRSASDLREKCWPFHYAVIGQLGIENVICVGVRTGLFVRKKLGAETLVDRRPIESGRKATHEVHCNARGQRVFTLIYPSIGHEWVSSGSPRQADPTTWVLGIAGRAQPPAE